MALFYDKNRAIRVRLATSLWYYTSVKNCFMDRSQSKYNTIYPKVLILLLWKRKYHPWNALLSSPLNRGLLSQRLNTSVNWPLFFFNIYWVSFFVQIMPFWTPVLISFTSRRFEFWPNFATLFSMRIVFHYLRGSVADQEGVHSNPPPCLPFINIIWKWKILVSMRPNYFIFMGYLRTIT